MDKTAGDERRRTGSRQQRSTRELAWEVLIVAFVLLLAAALRTCGQVEGADRVPPMANRYHRQLVREVRYYCGRGCDVAVFAAQIQVESTWRSGNCSAYACGLGQFTSGTARTLARMRPKDFPGGFDVLDPWQALRATALYDSMLLKGNLMFGDDAWAAALVEYNGGGPMLAKERKAAKAVGRNPNRWWCNVEHSCERTRIGACEESRLYPGKILHRWQKVYKKAGW